jgi:hypothetical protein
VCLDAGKRGSFDVSLLSAAAFDHLLLAAKAIPLPEPVRSAILASKPPGIWRMSVKSRYGKNWYRSLSMFPQIESRPTS